MTKTNTILNQVRTDAINSINNQETHIAISTDSNTPTVTDTSLGGTELREAVFSSSTSSTAVTKTMFLDVTEFNGNTINKAGTYNASTGGNLLGASITNAINKTGDIEMLVEIITEVEVINN